HQQALAAISQAVVKMKQGFLPDSLPRHALQIIQCEKIQCLQLRQHLTRIQRTHFRQRQIGGAQAPIKGLMTGSLQKMAQTGALAAPQINKIFPTLQLLAEQRQRLGIAAVRRYKKIIEGGVIAETDAERELLGRIHDSNKFTAASEKPEDWRDCPRTGVPRAMAAPVPAHVQR